MCPSPMPGLNRITLFSDAYDSSRSGMLVESVGTRLKLEAFGIYKFIYIDMFILTISCGGFVANLLLYTCDARPQYQTRDLPELPGWQ
jgi:hypothetical protein